MAAMSTSPKNSTHYLDHDDCPVHGSWPGSIMFDGERHEIVRCACGGFYYVPTQDEVFDL